jgi:hypothetical protein
MNKKLPVPENISLRWEAWRGVGAQEFTKSLLITATVLAAAIILAMAKVISVFIAVVVVILTFFVCVSAMTKLDNNQSIVDYVKKAASFRREQQSFAYENTAEEEIIPYEEEKN